VGLRFAFVMIRAARSRAELEFGQLRRRTMRTQRVEPAGVQASRSRRERVAETPAERVAVPVNRWRRPRSTTKGCLLQSY